jgi:GT2 family glycosyltransferase
MPTLTAVIPATNDPPTLAACLAAIEAAADGPDEVVVATEGDGPAEARNAGAEQATGDVLVFVDADVLPHADAFTRIRGVFANDATLTAVFGSYDDTPADEGVVSTFRNLLHHHVHHEGAGPATTFWTGLGAVRREEFFAIGGFNDIRYLEDVDLGMRLHDAGGRLLLDPLIQGTHLKRWTLQSMVWTDFAFRGLPWVHLLLQRRSPSDALNLGWRHRASALASLGVAVGLLRGRVSWVVSGLTGLVLLNQRFYELLRRRQGTAAATAGVGLHVIHHLAGMAAVIVGTARHARKQYVARRR